MRKWMSDRLKRRKKGGEGGSKEKAAAPEPLQPKYFESDLGEKPQAAAVEAPRPEPEPETQADFQLDSRHLDSGEESEPAVVTPSGEARSRPTRRRRKRGGRSGARRSPTEAASRNTPETAGPAEPLTPEAVAAEPPPAAPVAASEAVPVHVLHAAPARPSKGTVVLAIGLPGSGKSSWFKRHNIHPLSSDLLRELLFDDAQEQRFQDLVFSNLRSMLKARLIARRPMNYVDATNLTPHDRHSWIKLAKDYGYDVQGVFFDVPLEVCLERHQRRGRAVPEDIMRKMAGKLKAPTFEEGFSKITVVRVKQKDAAAG
jgi:predicted kinase